MEFFSEPGGVPVLGVHQDLERLGLLNGLEVGAEAILNELVVEDLTFGHLALDDDAGHRRLTRHDCSTPPPLADHDDVLLSLLVPTHTDRLQEAPGAN